MHMRIERTAQITHLRIVENAARDGVEFTRATEAALETLFANDAHSPFALLNADHWGPIAHTMTDSGIAIGAEDGLKVFPDMFWQSPTPWLARGALPAFPQQFVMTGGKRHPRRRSKPEGIVYSRHIPWLQRAFPLRTLDIEPDLPRFHRWMNDPRVAHFWEEDGDLAKHRA